MTIGKYASGKTVALLATSADTSGYFQIQSYASQGTTFGNIALNAQGGSVGIGTASPVQGQSTPISNVKLDVLGNQMLSNLSTTNTDQSKLFFFRSDGAVSSQGAVPDGLKMGAIEWDALTSGDNNNSIASARIETEASNTWSSASVRNADITFSTIGANSLTEKMRIDSSGNVNIGSSSSKTNNVGSSARGLTIANATQPVLSLWDTTNAGYNSHFFQVENNATLRSSGNLTIQTNAGTTALTIDSSQNATFAGDVTVSSATDEKPSLVIESTNASANGGELKFFKNTTDEADGDDLGNIRFNGINSAGTQVGYIQIKAEAVDVSDDSEDGKLSFSIFGNNVNDTRFVLDGNSRISLSNNDSGTSNTVFGYKAGNAITTGHNNVVMGNNALLNSQDIGFAVAIGNSAMSSGTMTNGADGTIAIGQSSLTNLTSGAKNTAIGFESGLATSAGSNNTYVGYESGQGASGSENNNTGIGKQSLFAVTTAESNVAVGTNTLDELTTGGYNTAIGANALHALDGGETENVAVGYNAGSNADGATNNICIGSNALLSTGAGTNQIVIGKDTTGVANNSVTLGNASVTAVYMAQDSGASIFCGDIFSGRASSGSTGNGHSIRSTDSAIFSRDAGGETVQVCRNADNGQFIQFRANGTIVGDIKNTGGTVSLTGFSGCHESSSSDTLEVGMVVSTIDEEHSENHAKVEISNTVGDKRVYGVVSDLEGLDGSNVTIASVGISSIKVTGSCVGGDLLESNGDGTAKVQSDDIIRSKTIGKVTMGNSTEEVKMVSCVLYCG
jgi:hypothetical protein